MLRGFYLSFGSSISKDINAKVHALAGSLLADYPEGITDILPSYTNLYIEFDSTKLSEEELRSWLANVANEGASQEPRELSIPVLYNGEDLADVAAQTGLSIAEVIKQHSAETYHVYAMGFTPGFPFMAEVPEALHVPRKAIPRAKVPAHSVAMTGAQAGIYPLSTPGGWNLLGSTLEPIFDPHREEAFLLRAGDQVRFYAAEGSIPAEPKRLELLPESPNHAVLKVLKAGLLDLMLDEGRFMAGRFGLGRSGPLDAPLAKLANKLVANPPSATLLEMTLTGPVFEVMTTATLVVTGTAVQPILNNEELELFTSFQVNAGDSLQFKSTNKGVRSYLAIAGGFESKSFMGSSSVDLKGFIGRPLALNDVLGQAEKRLARVSRSFRPYVFESASGLVSFRIVAGPQANEAALKTLTTNVYTVASADRMGIRFEGEAVAGSGIISEAVPIGAIQVTSGGMPILLLNDRGTLGGYEKPAIVVAQDLAKAAQLQQGHKVRFCLSGND